MRSLLIILCVFAGLHLQSVSAQSLAPYIKVGDYKDNISKTASVVQSALNAKGFEMIGDYNPEGKANLRVMVFTRNDLQQTTLKVKDRGALASVLKVGLINNNTTTTVSYLNPTYIFNAYLRSEYAKHADNLSKINADFVSGLSSLGNENKEYGGSVSVGKLQNYHYQVFMPYFTDPVTLKTFSSFEDGVAVIEKNLKANKSNTKLVYSEVFKTDKVAIFGVGLMNASKGEAHFLPIIGENNIAAMPYEIILQDNKATMLHGRFRIALHWPSLTMGTFMKIMSSPGNIEEALKSVCE
jgi:hypothetical protein